MKKLILILVALVIGILLYKKERLIIIPNESIRIRIISNSDKMEDLITKNKIKDKLENNLYTLLKDTNNIDEARKIIADNMENINKTVVNNINSDYKIDYGMNYFPKKVYRGVVYQEGNYESLVITLGKGVGENWWCVLFPPLCLIDEEKIDNDVDYQLYITNLLKN